MIKIEEIFRWYRDLPKMPQNLTTLQQEEWKNEHSTQFEKSFIGQKVSMCPAIILDIGHDKISAFAKYHLDYLVYIDGTHYHYEKNTSRKGYAQISYDIIYEKAIFYDQIKLIGAHEMVEIEGIITKINWSMGNEYWSSHNSEYYLSIQLSLTSIHRTANRFLHAELLDINLQYKHSLKRAKQDIGCFIATACCLKHF